MKVVGLMALICFDAFEVILLSKLVTNQSAAALSEIPSVLLEVDSADDTTEVS